MTGYHFPGSGFSPVYLWSVVALVGTVLVGLAYWPQLRAWNAFPAIRPPEIRAGIDRALRERPRFDAVDAAGRRVELRRDDLRAAEPGPCLRWYRRSDHERTRRRQLPVHGTAVFTCLVDLTVEDQGPLRAVVEIRFHTSPPAGLQGEAQMLPAALIPRVLDDLESRR